jgi:hypothetical protein
MGWTVSRQFGCDLVDEVLNGFSIECRAIVRREYPWAS